MSSVGQHIDLVVKHALLPTLRQAGFRGSGRTFHRRVGDAVQVVNIQASMSNSADEGRFTINLGIFFPAVASIIDPARVPPKPKEYQCTLRARIGKTMDVPTDHWWPIDQQTNDSLLGDEVARTFAASGLPWLERHSNIEAALDERNLGVIPRAACLMVLGRRREAESVVQAAISDEPERSIYLAAWSRKHDLVPSE